MPDHFGCRPGGELGGTQSKKRKSFAIITDTLAVKHDPRLQI